LIRSEVLGELKDCAAGLVALAELLASRRVGTKAIALALPSAIEACGGVAVAAEKLAADVLRTAGEHLDATSEIRAVFDRAIASVRTLEREVTASGSAPADARSRLVLERTAHDASVHVAAVLFVAEMFTAASAPRTVSIRVADVLGFGPALADGPHVIRATLDAPPEPFATTDARLLRALVELGVQLVAASGVSAPHVAVTSRGSGAHVRVGTPPEPATPAFAAVARRASSRPPPAQGTVLAVRRLPWSEHTHHLARAAAIMTGADLLVDASGRLLTVVFS